MAEHLNRNKFLQVTAKNIKVDEEYISSSVKSAKMEMLSEEQYEQEIEEFKIYLIL